MKSHPARASCSGTFIVSGGFMNTDDVGKMTQFSAGSIILKENDLNPTLFKIVHGHVELYIGYGTKQEVLLGIIGPQKCFGEFGLFLNRPALYTAVAYSPVIVMRIGKDEIADFVRANSMAALAIMKNMAHMIMVMQQQITLLSEELENAATEHDAADSLQQSRQVRTISGKELLRRYAICGGNIDLSGLYDNLA